MISSKTLNDDEQWLVDCCRLGRKADFSQRSNSTAVKPEISAELICQLILGYIDADGSQAPLPLPLGLRLRGARILGRLQLAYIRGSNGNDTCVPLVFEHCDFVTDASSPTPDQAIEPTVDLRHARCSHVAFIDCRLATLALDQAQIAGDLDLSGLRSIDQDGQCQVRARDAHLEGRIILSRAILRLKQTVEQSTADIALSEFACDLQGTVVEGDLVGSEKLAVFGGMVLPRQVQGNVDLRGASLTCSQNPNARPLALKALHSEIGGWCVMGPLQREHDILPFECNGITDIYGMKVGGTLVLSGSRFVGPVGENAEPAINATLLNVGGSVIMTEWTPRAGLPSSSASARMAVVHGSEASFRGATIGKDMQITLQNDKSDITLKNDENIAPLFCDSVCVAGSLSIEQINMRCSLQAMRIGGYVSLSTADSATPSVDMSSSTVGGNLWLNGQFEEIRAWGCDVRGFFGGPGYEAKQVIVNESRIQGQSHFRSDQSIYVQATRLIACATFTSTSKALGIVINTANLRADMDVVLEGRMQLLDMTMAEVGGHLNAAKSSTIQATFDGIRVNGNMSLPKNLFGPLSLKGGRVEGDLVLANLRLHLRRRPSGLTNPGINLRDMRINGRLRVEKLAREPVTGVLEELGETPTWLVTLNEKLEAQDEVVMLHRIPSFYKGAQIIEFHLRGMPKSDGNVSFSQIECHAFLLLADGHTIYLNGQSQPIHQVNAGTSERRRLHLDSEVQVRDYLRFFCGYVWGEEGAFVIIESLERSDWLQYMERDEELLASAPVPLQIRRDGDHWICQAVVLYGDKLYTATFRISSTGQVEMSEDILIARLEPQGVLYAKPFRRYQLTSKEVPTTHERGISPTVHHTRHEVIRDNHWIPLTDAAARLAIITRIQTPLVFDDKEITVWVDLRGCHCSVLDDNEGEDWGTGLAVDLRSFEYQRLAENGESISEVNRLFAGSDKLSDETYGEALGKKRSDWLELITQKCIFAVSPYEQLVSTLTRHGDPEAARTVLERRLQRENQRRPWWFKWCILIGLQWPFRYGLFSKRGVWVTLLYWLIGIIAFDIANYGALRLPPVGAGSSQLVVGQLPLPIRPVLVVDSQPVTMSVMSTLTGDKLVTAKVPLSDNLTQEVSCGDQVEPGLYALDVMLPLIDLHQESKCAISSADTIGPLLWRIFRALYAIGGAYMTSMLILSISGVMRRSTER